MPTMLRDRFWVARGDLQVQNALRHRKDAINLEELVTEARSLEEEFGELTPERSHVQ